MKMRLQYNWLLLFCGAALLSTIQGRRVRVRPLQEEQEDDNVQYYQPAEGSENIVLVSTADQYNGLYGQPTAQSRQDNYIQAARPTASSIKSHAVSRTKESSKAPPVQTIRNYNKVNDDGSFTFGYEAADGSFKEETRGTDCVVRGKYGYIDPDGNKREFTYVSGNPCDPNAPKESDESREEESNEQDNGPANYPTRPIRPIRPVTVAPKPAVTLFQNNYAQEEEEQPEPEQVLKPTVQTYRTRPAYIARPEYAQQSELSQPQLFQRPRLLQATTPSSVLYRQSITPISITPRPASATSPRPELPATTYRPQLLQVAVTPRPSSLLYTKTSSSPSRPPVQVQSTTNHPLSYTRGNVDFDAEFQKFQQENNIVSPTPSSLLKTTQKGIGSSPSPSSAPIYSSALVYDPSSGQYNTQLYQTLPQTSGDFSLSQRIQPYVHQPQNQLVNLQRVQQQSPLYRQYRPQSNNQALYQQQQAELQFQNSAQLFAQQQKARAQQQQQQTSPQRYYYIQPSVDQTPSLSGGQIDAFLRGHNIQF